MVFSLSSLAQGEKKNISIIFAGDIMGHDSQIESARAGDSFDYDTCFSLVRPYLEEADIAIANLEVTLGGPPYKGYPQFSSPDELADAARKAGFDLFITANNHSLDRRKKGLERTLDVLKEKNIIHTGTFKTHEERQRQYPLVIEKNGIRIAILNYTYGTNGIRVQKPNVVNYIDKEIIATDLKKVKNTDPDFIIVTLHWGLEYQRDENAGQAELATFIAENGADAIIGSHPHVVQPIKEIEIDQKKVPVVYSLGNFISNQRKRYTDGGILFQISLEKTDSTRITDFRYLPTWVYKPARVDGGNHFVIVPGNKKRDYYESLNFSDIDYEKISLFYKDVSSHLEGIKEINKNY